MALRAAQAKVRPNQSRGTTVQARAATQNAPAKVAINGFGRIGRNFLRCLHDRPDSPIEVVAINQSGGIKQNTHLLKYDSVLGTFNGDVQIVDDETFTIDGKQMKLLANRDPAQLPWKDMNIDIVIEGTGVFVDSAGAGKHIQAGAKRVLITAPAKGADIPTYVMGVNQNEFDPTAQIVSNASCTTNCMAPFVKVLNDKFGIEQGTMSTTHSYTGDQRLLDASHKDLRRARGAAMNVVPTSTGAAKAVALVMPEMKGKLDGLAFRVPTPNVSLVDMVVNTKEKNLTAEKVNDAFKESVKDPATNHVLRYTDEPLVSSDFQGTEQSATIDGSLTQVMGDGGLVKVVAFYDNEYGYSMRCLDLANIMARSLEAGYEAPADPLEEFCRNSPDADECRVYE